MAKLKQENELSAQETELVGLFRLGEKIGYAKGRIDCLDEFLKELKIVREGSSEQTKK